MTRLLGSLPLARSLRGQPPDALRSDLIAGVTVGVMLIPQGMAYALIAGLPPVYGLYAAMAPLAAYALLGTSRELAVGPVAMVALLVASGVSPLAGGDPQRYLALTLILSALVGVMQLGLGLARGGFLVNLFSHPVLAGFTSAAAIIIATSQLGGLTGLRLDKGPVHEMVVSAATGLGEIHAATMALGLSAIVLGFLLRRFVPRLPGAMILVTVGVLLSWATSMGAAGVDIVGRVPTGLPAPTLPALGGGVTAGDITALLPIALAIALVGFMESFAVAKVYASKRRYDIDPNQELKALGVANLVGSAFQAFPVTGGFSRTAVNAEAGARTQRSSLVSVGVIVVTLVFLTPLFYHLPKAILAAIIVVAVLGLVDVAGARELWRLDKRDFTLMMATFAATLLLGIEEGIVVGLALSMIVVLHQISRPHIAELGRIPETRQYRNVRRHSNAIVEPGIAVVRLDASLFYGNAEAFRAAARRAYARAERSRTSVPPTLVIDAYPMNRVDSTGIHVLHQLIDEVHESGGRIHLAGVKGPLHDTLVLGGIVSRIGPDRVFDEVWRAVAAAGGGPRTPEVALIM